MAARRPGQAEATPLSRLTVFASNIAGSVVFAFLAVRGHALRPDDASELVRLGSEIAARHHLDVFGSAIVGGWLIALLAWLVTAADWTIGHLAVTWVLAFIVGLGHFAHCIASSSEILAAVWRDDVSVMGYGGWLAVATAGNVLGGVMVTLLNFAQVAAGGDRKPRD